MELSDEVANSETAYMYFTIPVANGTTDSCVYVKNVRTATLSSGKTYYIFKCNVAAKEMSSQITAQMKDGTESGTQYTYSVRDYADYLLGHVGDSQEYTKAEPLVKAMLNYGARAQIYFDKNTDDLANKNLTITDQNIGDVSIICDSPVYNLSSGITYDGATLSLKSETSLSLYFISESNLEFSCEGKTVEKAANGKYQVARIRGINAKELKNSFKLCINGNSFVIYSPMNYCYNVLQGSVDDTLINTIKALYLYSDAADAFFKDND